mmetsp:Transcript_560/g.2115  ORF Transcript_560/g.2115 Transcript_560/m.2115 type:complete len:239 (-) Transcript_560:697-1413(-)
MLARTRRWSARAASPKRAPRATEVAATVTAQATLWVPRNARPRREHGGRGCHSSVRAPPTPVGRSLSGGSLRLWTRSPLRACTWVLHVRSAWKGCSWRARRVTSLRSPPSSTRARTSREPMSRVRRRSSSQRSMGKRWPCTNWRSGRGRTCDGKRTADAPRSRRRLPVVTQTLCALCCAMVLACARTAEQNHGGCPLRSWRDRGGTTKRPRFSRKRPMRWASPRYPRPSHHHCPFLRE